jgi:hypothetical protein
VAEGEVQLLGLHRGEGHGLQERLDPPSPLAGLGHLERDDGPEPAVAAAAHGIVGRRRGSPASSRRTGLATSAWPPAVHRMVGVVSLTASSCGTPTCPSIAPGCLSHCRLCGSNFTDAVAIAEESRQ